MGKDAKREYKRDGLTVVWKPEVCIHSGICAGGLPEVFQPKQKPWIQMDSADLARIEEQVAQCPSGALTTRRD